MATPIVPLYLLKVRGGVAPKILNSWVSIYTITVLYMKYMHTSICIYVCECMYIKATALAGN